MEKNYTDDELEIKFKEILEYYKSMYSPTENPNIRRTTRCREEWT